MTVTIRLLAFDATAAGISTLESDEVRQRKWAVDCSDNRGRLASPLEGKWAPPSGRNHVYAIHVTYRMCRPTLTPTASAASRQAGGRAGARAGF